MGKAVIQLQNKLPLARVVYASATGEYSKYVFTTTWKCLESLWFKGWCFFHSAGASEPKNMIYMSRLGIWGEGTQFKTFDDFLHAIEKRFVEYTLLVNSYSVWEEVFSLAVCTVLVEVWVPWRLLPWTWRLVGCTLHGNWASQECPSASKKSTWTMTSHSSTTKPPNW